ncbi:Soluble pyridine nucleotide transhydrogenase [Mycobacterium avium subsp. paratuberculosis]|nr:Soluble pyridine nucleotide transhydrogenase [Mycobacterium avium subsp. paratuberculosis]CAG6933737.1 Soluble pyridine nucleotide transhydrogenase [Mycobacterium avium subsp. paratuberculosis]CAG6934033.1 Soluble pyridine nucleotide transhydrogenase [Mycobacterium avium subsp. paratuberculosis]CAG6934276.1 Soluble pyridine nucleotide transhydrogenase [Mycobacterium avium subsp. paratuberculosis]
MTKHFDAIIVGAGQAGPPLAGRLTAAGQRVAIIERKLIGGTCVNTGCIPTKTLVASAHAAHLARRGADYGVGTGAVSVDMAKVKARKDEIMLGDRKGVEDWLAGMAGCTVVRGHARFRDPHTLQVGEDLLRAERIFLNVGGRAVVPDIPAWPRSTSSPTCRSSNSTRCQHISSSSAEATSRWSSPRCTGASGPR